MKNSWSCSESPPSRLGYCPACRLLLTVLCLLLTLFRRIVSCTRPRSRVLHVTQLYFDLTKLTVVKFVGRIVTEAVLGAEFVGHLGKSGAGLLWIGGGEILSA